MAKLDEDQAKIDAQKIFTAVNAKLETIHKAHLQTLKGGKLYEFYCLAQVLRELALRHGVTFKLAGGLVAFKGAPGMIHSNDPHFQVWDNIGATHLFDIYVDIEFETLGYHHAAKPPIRKMATSYRHELDIVAVPKGTIGYPQFHHLLLGVECKSNADFGKWIVKQVLGVRREMSYIDGPNPTAIYQIIGTSPTETVTANPPSEFWLAYVDPKGDDYKDSPAQFGIEFKHWQP